jgi:hypothetical protein
VIDKLKELLSWTDLQGILFIRNILQCKT